MIEIRKSERILILKAPGGTAERIFPISLGASPVGSKQKEGDGRTPEGEYRIVTRNANSKFHKSLGISYPNAKDAKRALKNKQISIAEYLSIRLPLLLGLRPSWKTPLGGFVMIHGESPEGKTGDWTQGCIALNNKDMDLLFESVKKGESVRIDL